MKQIPENGAPAKEVLAQIRRFAGEDAEWREGRTFSLVYFAGQEVLKLTKRAYESFFCENALSPSAFPSLRQMEGEVIAMTASMLGGDDAVTGTMTSGGSESLMLAVKTARDRARAEKGRDAQLTMVLPSTAHPALLKAAHYLDIEAIIVPVGPDFRADVAAMAAAVDERTALIVGSAPAYPHGVVDPIEALAAVARDANVPMHVDACLGGFMLPWVRRLGHPVPAFDFSVPGVTSMSADLHKYGFAAKGASVVLYRDVDLLKHQIFAHAEWSGGLYGSAGVLGTRPGGAIAAAWAALNHLGVGGYMSIAKRVMETTRRLQSGIVAHPGMRILGEPEASIFAFASDNVDTYALGQALQAKRWHVDLQQLPPALHMMITPAHEAIVEPLLADLAAALESATSSAAEGLTGMPAFYGMAATLPDRGPMKEMIVELMSQLHTGG